MFCDQVGIGDHRNGPKKSNELFLKAAEFWNILRTSFDQGENEWKRGIYVILSDLAEALEQNPRNIEAQRMRVEMIADKLGGVCCGANSG